MTVLPSGSVPPQKRQPSATGPAFIIDESAAGALADASRDGNGGDAAGDVGGPAGDATGKVAFTAGVDPCSRAGAADFASEPAAGAVDSSGASPGTVNALMRRSASGARDTFDAANSRNAPG